MRPGPGTRKRDLPPDLPDGSNKVPRSNDDRLVVVVTEHDKGTFLLVRGRLCPLPSS
jgi:hypothetical protein